MIATMTEEYRYPHSKVQLPVLQPAAQPAAPSTVETTSAPREAFSARESTPLERKLLEGKVIEALREIYDPEIPVNIYELGLIYNIAVNPDDTVKVTMTLTAPACPVAGSLPGEVEKKVEAIPEVRSAEVELVWEPAWSRDRMSEAALLTLGML